MSFEVNPISNPQAWDFITVAGVNSPIIKGKLDCKRTYKWDVKEGKGTQGATETFVGVPPVKFSVTFYLYLVDDFRKWDEFRALLTYDPTKKDASAVDIYHPSLADIGVKSVVVESIGAVTYEGNGEYNVTVEFLEYTVPPKASAVSTPKKSDAQGTSQFTATVGGTPSSGAQNFNNAIADNAGKATSPATTGATVA